MPQFDLLLVHSFVPTSSLSGVDAIVTHPTDSSRVATENICTCWSREKAELVLTALEYYRKHVLGGVAATPVGGWLELPRKSA
jgi:hypothetical protein